MFRLAISSRSVNRNAVAELLAEAQAVGLLRDRDPWQIMERFYALLWGDLMIGRLLGVTARPEPAEIDQRAHEAAEALLKLYGSPNCGGR